jgi:hypothetical protein
MAVRTDWRSRSRQLIREFALFACRPFKDSSAMKLCLFSRRLVITAMISLAVCDRTAIAAKPDADVAAFIAAKRKQTETTAGDLGARIPEEVAQMFDAATSGDWQRTSNLFHTIIAKYKPEEQSNAKGRLVPEVWYAVQEVGGFCEFLAFRDPKFIRLFAEDTFKVIPDGSVYFGGTDPGRFIITALSRSHAKGEPFFTITQNQLVATNYLEYLRRMYAARLTLPPPGATAKAFTEYSADLQRRWQHDRDFPNEPRQVAPGEQIRVVNNRLQAEGPTAVMAVNGLVAKAIVEANPDKQFFVEESYPLAWMYPRLSPVGPIFKLHAADLETLGTDTVFQDRRYWSALTERLVGLRVTDQTTIEQVCAFAESGSAVRQGDPAFVRDHDARNNFAKLRSAPAGIYAWRATQAKSSAEKRRMANEAEFAFKQSYALYPRNPETVWRYTMFLVGSDRSADAQTFVKAAAKLNPRDPTVDGLVKYVEQVIDWKKTSGRAIQ